MAAMMLNTIPISADACQNGPRLLTRQTAVAQPHKGKTSVSMSDSADDLAQRNFSKLLAAVGRDRDIEAFEEIFRHYSPKIRAYMAKLARDGQAAEELMQETMLAVWNKAEQFDPLRGNVSSWIFTIEIAKTSTTNRPSSTAITRARPRWRARISSASSAGVAGAVGGVRHSIPPTRLSYRTMYRLPTSSMKDARRPIASGVPWKHSLPSSSNS